MRKRLTNGCRIQVRLRHRCALSYWLSGPSQRARGLRVVMLKMALAGVAVRRSGRLREITFIAIENDEKANSTQVAARMNGSSCPGMTPARAKGSPRMRRRGLR